MGIVKKKQSIARKKKKIEVFSIFRNVKLLLKAVQTSQPIHLPVLVISYGCYQESC